MQDTVFTPALEALPSIKSAKGDVLAKQFIQVCGLVLPVIETFVYRQKPCRFRKDDPVKSKFRKPDLSAKLPKVPWKLKAYAFGSRAREIHGFNMAASAYFREERDRQSRPSDFAPTLDVLNHMRNDKDEILTKPFVDVCKSTLPVVEKFGTAMALVKSDIGGNISRLDARYESDPASYQLLYNIVRKEIADKTAKHTSSCTNGLLWLTRAMDFLVELFRNLLLHPDWTMTQAANESYVTTLKPWHGWIAGAAFTVAIKLVPERKKFYDTIGGGANLNEDIETFVLKFSPILAENHKFLESVGMDDGRSF